jgi:hypothetical protein
MVQLHSIFQTGGKDQDESPFATGPVLGVQTNPPLIPLPQPAGPGSGRPDDGRGDCAAGTRLRLMMRRERQADRGATSGLRVRSA